MIKVPRSRADADSVTVLSKVRRSPANVADATVRFTSEQLQEIVDAEGDAQVLLAPAGDALHVTHANHLAAALLQGSDRLPEIRTISTTCRTVWADGRPVNLTNIPWPGEHRWFDVRIRRLYGRVSAVFTDVTQRHDSQDALIDSQCRYRLLAENAGDLVFQVRGKRLEWVSTSVHELLGWDQPDIVGRRVVELVHPQDRDVVVEACGNTTEPTRFEARFKHRDGEWIWVSVLMRPAQDLGGCMARVGSGRAIVQG